MMHTCNCINITCIILLYLQIGNKSLNYLTTQSLVKGSSHLLEPES